jgi:hypothetical protein
MWERLEINVNLIAPGNTPALGHAQSSIFEYLHHIRIKAFEVASEAKPQLQLLISRLPPGRILSFECCLNVSPETLRLLLQGQYNVKFLDIAGVTALTTIGEEATTQTSLSHVSNLSCVISQQPPTGAGSTDQAFQSFDSMIKSMPKLRSMHLRSDDEDPAPVNFQHILPNGDDRLDLRCLKHLALEQVNLAPVSQSLPQQIGVAGLQGLQLYSCRRLGLFLGPLSKTPRLEKGASKYLSIDSVSSVHATQRFLNICPLLSELRLEQLGSSNHAVYMV